MPSTFTDPATRADLNTLKHELKSEIRAEMDRALADHDHRERHREDIERVLSDRAFKLFGRVMAAVAIVTVLLLAFSTGWTIARDVDDASADDASAPAPAEIQSTPTATR